MKIGRTTALFIVLGALIVAVIALPIANIFFEQFAFDLQGFLGTLADVEVLRAVGLSCFAAFLAVLVTFAFGVPLAYLLARRDFRGKALVEGVIDLPMAIPHVVAGIMLLTVFGLNGLIGGPVSSFLRFEGALPGIVIAMLFVSAPFLINSAKEGFRSVDPRLEKVARSLGATEWQAFRRVAFPLAFPHILSGAIMSWARAISEFAAVIMLVGFFPMIAPGMVWSRFYSQGLYEGMRVAVVLLLITLLVFMGLKYMRGRIFDKY
jgi:molybdate/tungstate transport system permease protein